MRVPLVIFDPRQAAFQRGRSCDDLALNVDFAPTFCEWAGIKPPAAMQGRSLRPLVVGQSPGDWRKDFYFEFKWSRENIPSAEAVCSEDWKYIKWLASGTEELFELRRDPHEVNNLSQNPEFAAELSRERARLAALRKEVGGTPIEQLKRMPYGVGMGKPRFGEASPDE